MLSHHEQQKIIGDLLRRKENALCADCNSKMPCWASLDFGVFVCMNCSGAHRALGPSVTRVKSTRLDTWNRDWLQNMQVGNSILNMYWQNQLNDSQYSPKKPTTNSSIQDIIKYIQDKYMRKLYVDPLQKMNPLQKYKSGESLITQNYHKNKQMTAQNKVQKILPENPKKEVKNQSVQPPRQQQKKTMPDFTVFDTFVKTTKQPAKPTTNLLNLEQDKTQNASKNVSFDDFQFGSPNDKNKQVKYNKQLFVSMGGIAAGNIKKEVSFDSFRKINADQKPNNKNNDFLSFDLLIQRKNQKSNTNSYLGNMNYFQVNQPSYNNANNKNIYSTMGGYPPNAIQPHLQKIGHLKRANTLESHDIYNTSYGVNKNMYQKQAPKISLQSNLNFDKVGEKVQKKTSWIDEWK